MKRIVYFVLFVFFASSCFRNSDVEKSQNHSTNIIDVKESVKEIIIDTPFDRRGGRDLYRKMIIY